VEFAASSDAAAHLFAGALPNELTITGADARHLARVRRLGPGDAVTVADGVGAWRRYEIVQARRDRLDLGSAGPPVREPLLRPALAVAFAITKGAKPELVVRQLTELGVDRIRPSYSERSVPRWDDQRAANSLERFRRIASEAAAQCRRATLPVVEEPGPLVELAGDPGLVVADRGGSLSVPDGDWTLVVGPEGGLAAAELATLGEPPRLAIGPHVLRADTAAVVAAAILTTRRRPQPGHRA
jgi:16S rRNA (uracil1498-N3)-methyltransferase